VGLFNNSKKNRKVSESAPDSVAPADLGENRSSSSEIADVYASQNAGEAVVMQREVVPVREDKIEVTAPKSYQDKKPVKHVIGQTKILAIINQKGGVGKSTTAINLSAALGAMNKQVLLVYLDPQGNSSSGLGIEKSAISNCIYDVLLNDVPLEDVIIPDVCEGLDIAPATINLAGAEVELVSEMARENRLKDAVGSMRGKYDFIVIILTIIPIIFLRCHVFSTAAPGRTCVLQTPVRRQELGAVRAGMHPLSAELWYPVPERRTLRAAGHTRRFGHFQC
jgi:chromosome partitioning protein